MSITRNALMTAALLMAGGLSTVARADSPVESQYFALGPWMLCNAGISFGAPCDHTLEPGKEPGMLRFKVPADSLAVRFAYALECRNVNGPVRITGTLMRTDFAGGWTSLQLYVGCVMASSVAAIELTQ